MESKAHDSPGCWTLILVHGTWGRGFFPGRKHKGAPRWFEDGSGFRSRLTGAFEREGLRKPDYYEHHWSGHNALFARERSALALARHIKAWRLANPSKRLALIGHSHGGNVLLRTLAHIGDRHPPPAMVSLATPFVELAADEFAHVDDNVIIEVVGALFLIFAIGIVSVVAGLDWLIYLLVEAAITVTVLWRMLRSEGRIEKARRKVTALVRRSSQRALVETAAPMLVIRGVNDEAALALAAGAIAARIGYIVDRFAGRIIHLAAAAIVLIVGSFMASRAHVTGAAALARRLEPYYIETVIIFLVTLALFGLGNAISRMAPAVYGRELFLMPADIEVNSHSTPDASQAVTIQTLLRRTNLDGRMRHGIYDEPGCAEAIALWLKSQVT